MTTWELYYLNIVGWKLHPRNRKKLDLAECAKLATAMQKEQEKWHGSHQ